LIGCILLTKSLLCNVAAFIGMPFSSESSDIQSLFIRYGKSLIMTSYKCHKLQEGYFSVQGRFCADSYSEKSDPKLPSERLDKASGRSSVSNIHLDDMAILSRPHQCLEVSNCTRLHPSGRNGKLSDHYLEFEKNPAFKCICRDDVAISFGSHSMFDK
jgi:hypothetical protein